MSNECPVCGDLFDTEMGMKCHHAQIHGESIAGTEVTCANCGSIFRVAESRVSRTNNFFCPDSDCYGEWLSENYSGKDSPLYERVKVSCSWCESEFNVPHHRIEQSEKLFCPDSDCVGKWFSENKSGEDSPLYDRVDASCEWCNSSLEIIESIREKYDKHFCSDSECRANWISENLTKEDHPTWSPGGNNVYYGPNWDEQREKVLERDKVCQVCGMDVEEHIDKYGRNLDVHHIVPINEFDDFSKANDISNLVLLCRSCHRGVECGEKEIKSVEPSR